MLNKLVHSVCPDFPDDIKNVKSSSDMHKWFKVIYATNTLIVPPINYIRTNPIIIDKFIESLKAFEVMDLNDRIYDWDNLNLYEYSGADVLKGLKFLESLTSGATKVACDIETKKVEWEDNLLLAIGFAVDENTCVALRDIPIIGSKSDYHDTKVFEALQSFLNRKDIKFIWHNGKFDCGRLKYLCNLDAHVDEDTMLQHYARINEKRGTHGLKDLGQLYLQAPAWDDELDNIKRQWCKEHKVKLSDFMYDSIPTSVLIPYMQRDCIATYRLNNLFDELAKPTSEFIYRKLIEASNVYMRVELNGMRLDTEYLEDLEYSLEKEYNEAMKKLTAVSNKIWNPLKYSAETGAKVKANEPFNIKSPKQLKWMLSTLLHYPVPSTDAQMISDLLDDIDAGRITDPLAIDFISTIGIVRKNVKYMDTYVQGLRENLCRDFRIRGTFNLHGTETGRLSSSNPNMQNIPRDKRIKNLFNCTPGYKLLQLDYSQAELRVLAVLSGDPWLTQIYIDGKDLHDAIATDMFGPNFNKEQRVMAKTINFGIAYGRGPGSIAQTFKKSMAEATALINQWYKPMPKVKEYINGRRAMATRGEECVTLFGRERHFVIMNDNLNHIQNEYINTPIQSVASDLTMFSLLELDKYQQESGLDFRIVTTVHDSIILEVKDDAQLIDKVAKKCLSVMAETPKKYIPDLKVPFKADAEVGYSYGGLEEWKPLE